MLQEHGSDPLTDGGLLGADTLRLAADVRVVGAGRDPHHPAQQPHRVAALLVLPRNSGVGVKRSYTQERGEDTMDRKKYTDEFKREAVRLAQERGNLAQVARDLGINDTLP